MAGAHHITSIKGMTVGNDLPFVLIAGPCVLESEKHALTLSTAIKKICDKLKIPLVYKTSFDKANRSSIESARGLGMAESLRIFSKIKSETGLPLLTDYHERDQAAEIAPVVDVLQVPAFLCRQTDLLLAGGKTGKPMNVKKGQFLAPEDMANIVSKIESTGNHDVMLCERGVSFGYRTLVNDFRALPIMAKTGKPIIFDATHSVQSPGGLGKTSGGQREFVFDLARAAVAVGVAGLFLEVHEDPDHAPSDGPNMLHLADLENILRRLQQIDRVIKE
ncbi:MAG: 3-deoxy-8-phosphooctulonate synthase [Hydrotalea sp.]|nr:3-deoxy-8-phosphooctulonate synthase [Hydrotalea sp.]